MNLIKGQIITSAEERDAVFNTLQGDIYHTLNRNALNVEMVLNALDKFSKMIGQEHLNLLVSSGISTETAERYFKEAKNQLDRKNLVDRLTRELKDNDYSNDKILYRENDTIIVKEKLLPLGTLFHVTAGNQFGLALYSVIEGLLTGNINLIKFSSKDNGYLQVMIFNELIQIEPLFKEYIYIFNYTSKDTEAIKKLIDIADAIVVWGGDESIQAIRRMADSKTRIIEWGHKLSFAYVTLNGFDEQSLYGLAKNIIETNQLLCSSCQGIYLDTDSMEDIYRFCEIFIRVLDECFIDFKKQTPIEIQAKTGLMVYNERLENPSCRVFQGNSASLLAYEDSTLETTIPYANPWIKRLPRHKLIKHLRPHKSHLQTVGLLCSEFDKNELSELLWKAGVTRVTNGKNMSSIYNGAAHDGEFSLRRYTRVASQEFIDT